jgi:hypothetical protein
MLQRHLLPPSSVTKQTQQEAGSSAWYFLGLLFDPEDGSNTFLQNIGKLLPDNTVSHLSALNEFDRNVDTVQEAKNRSHLLRHSLTP